MQALNLWGLNCLKNVMFQEFFSFFTKLTLALQEKFTDHFFWKNSSELTPPLTSTQLSVIYMLKYYDTVLLLLVS